MLRFVDQPMPEVMAALAELLRQLAPGERVAFEVPDPDAFAPAPSRPAASSTTSRFSGELAILNGQQVRYRDHACWLDLAEVLGTRFGTPTPLADGFMRLNYTKLDLLDSWHRNGRTSGDSEKYGVDTTYARIHKFEVPSFARHYSEAVRFLRLPPNPRVLSIGCNQGAELAQIPGPLRGVGLDHSASAIQTGRRRFPDVEFHVVDLSQWDGLSLGRFDAVVAINTLQSATFDGRAVFRRLVKDTLKPEGGVIVGLPNSRYEDHVLRFGTRAKHRAAPDAAGLLKDAMFYRRYLTQQRFEVSVAGKYTWLIAGRRLQGSA